MLTVEYSESEFNIDYYYSMYTSLSVLLITAVKITNFHSEGKGNLVAARNAAGTIAALTQSDIRSYENGNKVVKLHARALRGLYFITHPITRYGERVISRQQSAPWNHTITSTLRGNVNVARVHQLRKCIARIVYMYI